MPWCSWITVLLVWMLSSPTKLRSSFSSCWNSNILWYPITLNAPNCLHLTPKPSDITISKKLLVIAWDKCGNVVLSFIKPNFPHMKLYQELRLRWFNSWCSAALQMSSCGEYTMLHHAGNYRYREVIPVPWKKTPHFMTVLKFWWWKSWPYTEVSRYRGSGCLKETKEYWGFSPFAPSPVFHILWAGVTMPLLDLC